MAGVKRQERAAATQSQLLEAAREVFCERGYQATSVAAITDAASTARGTFYLYFRNKEDVFAQLMATAMDELYRHTLTDLDPETHMYDPNVARDRVAGFLKVAAAQGKIWRASWRRSSSARPSPRPGWSSARSSTRAWRTAWRSTNRAGSSATSTLSWSPRPLPGCWSGTCSPPHPSACPARSRPATRSSTPSRTCGQQRSTSAAAEAFPPPTEHPPAGLAG